MPQFLAVVKLGKKSGIPEDAVENTFAFASTVSWGTDVGDDYFARLTAFYNEHPGSESASISDYLSNALDVGDDKCQISFYEITGHLDGSPHGAPLDVRTFTLASVGSSGIPDEVAACLSYRCDYDSDVEFGTGSSRPRARDRGRVYLGPLAFAAIDQYTVSKETFLKTAFRDVACAAGADLAVSTAAGSWSVWSRADATLKPVTHGWMDDAPDTQRRRGNAAQFRTTF